MANLVDAYWNQDAGDANPGVVQVDLVFTAGTAGAVPSFSASNINIKKAITSVTLSTNAYNIVFNNQFSAFLNGYGNVIQATPSAAGAFQVKCTAVSVNADGGATATLTPYTADGNATSIHLATGDILSFTFRFLTKAPTLID